MLQMPKIMKHFFKAYLKAIRKFVHQNKNGELQRK